MTKATVLLLTAFLCTGAANPCGEPGFHVTSKGLMAWTALKGGWVLAGLKVSVMSVVKEMVAKKPAGVEALKAYERVASEKGNAAMEGQTDSLCTQRISCSLFHSEWGYVLATESLSGK